MINDKTDYAEIFLFPFLFIQYRLLTNIPSIAVREMWSFNEDLGKCHL